MSEILSPSSTADDNQFEDEQVPSEVKTFVKSFYNKLKKDSLKDAEVLTALYEVDFTQLSEKFYKNSPWPSAEAIARILDIDEKEPFVYLYKEMAYRHIYTKMVPTLQHRFESFYNYTNFFDMIIESETLEFDLPNVWLWDMLDEFVYQYQSYAQYRTRLRGKTDEELQFIREHSDVWSTRTVIGYLEALTQRADIIDMLESEKQGLQSAALAETVASEPESHVYRMLGYYAIIELLRVHCLLGDYHLALKSIDAIDLTPIAFPGATAAAAAARRSSASAAAGRSLSTLVTSCHTSLVYYVGFCYLMLRRYVDAARILAAHLVPSLSAARSKSASASSAASSVYQSDFLEKRRDQLYALLAIVIALCPSRIDDNVHATLREKFGDKIYRMNRGDDAVFEELFNYSCPKFVSAAPPADESQTTPQQQQSQQSPQQQQSQQFGDVVRYQTRLFMKEVQQQQFLNTIRSYLKLYSSLPISKLAKFVENTATAGDSEANATAAATATATDSVSAEDLFRQQLLSVKHKTRQLVWSAGEPALAGKWAAASDVDFFIEGDTIHVADPQSQSSAVVTPVTAPLTAAAASSAAAGAGGMSGLGVSKRYTHVFASRISKLNDLIRDLQK